MSIKVPKYIAETYVDGAHGFRAEKRKQARELKRVLGELRLGCAHFPCREHPVNVIKDQIEIILKSISVKEWGR